MDPKGLIIRAPFVDWILDGLKRWEIRGSATKVRGPLALIQGGSGTMVGTCQLVDVIGPLDEKTLRANASKLNVQAAELGPLPYGDHTFAWVLASPKRLDKPVPYDHPRGAVIWVTLGAGVLRQVGF